MSKENYNQIKIGAVLSYLNLGIGNLLPIFYTPIMLALLGQSEYGLYKIASSTSSYLSLMALGISGAVSRFLIKARAEGGQEAEERIFGLFQRIFNVIAILTCVVGAIVVLCLDTFYSAALTAPELLRMRILVALMIANMAVSFSSSAYASALTTHERFIFIQCTNILSTVIGPLLNIVVLWLGCGSIGMTITALAINVLIRFLQLIYVRRVLRLCPKYDNLPKHQLKDIFKFSLWIFVASIAGQLYNSTDTVIIGSIPALATVGAAVYNVGITFPNIMFSLAQITPTLFSPKATKMVFSGASDADLTNMVIRVGRLQGFVVILFCSGFIAFGQPFLHWYVGAEYSEAYWVASIILVPNCIPLVQSAANSIMQAKNMHRFRAILYLCIAVVNVVATWFLVQKYGIIGASIPTGLAFFIGHGITLNLYYWKKVKLNIPLFWKKMLPIIVSGTLLCCATLLLSNLINFYRISTLLSGIILYTAIYFVILWCFVFYPDEKAIFSEPIKKAYQKILARKEK